MKEIRAMFSEQWVRKNMIPAKVYHPYPKPDERDFWNGLAPELRAHLLEKGERYLHYEWKGLPATAFLEYERTGNRALYEDMSYPKRMALGSLMMAECVENQGRFLDDIINGVWSICEESTWAISAHTGDNCKYPGTLPDALEDAVLDLFSLETALLIAFSYYLFKDKMDAVSPQIAKRIRGELQRRTFAPYLERDDCWWMGFHDAPVNNWSPWCTASVLGAFTVACENDEMRAAAVNKAIDILDNFVATYAPDGACLEGCGYWERAAASMMDVLETISDATGHQVSFENEKLRKMGQFICETRICGERYVNFGDCAMFCKPEAARIFCYGKTMRDPMMMAEGAAIKKMQGNLVHYVSWYSMRRVFEEIMCFDEMKAYAQKPVCNETAWWENAQMMIARESQNRGEGYTLIAKGGHNGVSHNHNDVGSFMLYEDEKTLFIDIGVERYTAKTFSPQRYEIWTMRSGYHNVPQIGGAEQLPGEEYGARRVKYEEEQGVSTLSAEIGGAYGAEAGVRSWQRSFRLDRNRSAVQICDRYDLEKEQVLEFHFMTQAEPMLQEDGVKIGASAMKAVGAVPQWTVEKIEVTDKNLQANWGNALYRITAAVNGQKGEVCFEIKR